jgi:small ligand-binding sensory domain FIST
MATRAGVGMSRHHNPNVAGREAAEQALKKAGVSKPDFVFVFGSIGYGQRSLVRAVREATGGVPAVKMADGSITVQTEVQEDTSVWFSSRDKEKVSNGCDRMAQQIKEQLGGEKPKLVFQCECATRGKTMFREQEKLQILKRFRQSLDPDAPWVGFYTVGEIGPVEEHNLRHLYTSVVVALR